MSCRFCWRTFCVTVLLRVVSPMTMADDVVKSDDSVSAMIPANAPDSVPQSFSRIIYVGRNAAVRDLVPLLERLMDSRLQSPESGIELAKGVNGPIISRGVITARMQSTLAIPDGQSAVAGVWKGDPKSGQVPSIVVILARIVDPTKPRASVVNDPAIAPVTAAPVDQPGQPSPARRTFERATSPRTGFRPPALSAQIRNPDFVRQLNLTVEQQQQLENLRLEVGEYLRSRPTQDMFEKFRIGFEQKHLDLLTHEQKKTWAAREEELQKEIQESRHSPVRPAAPTREATPPDGAAATFIGCRCHV